MLYDPKWNQPSLRDFIGWLETHDPAKRYRYDDNCGGCLVGQYMKARGIEWNYRYMPEPSSYGMVVNKLFGDDPVHVGYLNPRGRGEREVLAATPQTFGGALKRAKAFEKELEKCDA